ncbi:MAG: DUF87 domain-containing protein [Acutalibacteraceae bacterium]|nr:DUF87 domain-containing protein [Acutalibacteraceae bacterium]
MKKKQKNNSNIVITDPKQEDEDLLESQSKKIKKTSQQTILFDEIYENGVIRTGNTFSIAFRMENVDYKMMKEDDKEIFYDNYQKFLNSMPAEIRYQELIDNGRFDRNLLQQALMPSKTVRKNGYIKDELIDDHIDIQSRKLSESDENCEKVIYGAISYTTKHKLDNPSQIFKYEKEIATRLLQLGINITRLTAVEYMKLIHNIYNPTEDFMLPDNLYQADVNLKDYIAPVHFDFKSKYNRTGKYVQMGDTFARVMFAKRFSTSCDDEFLYDLMDNNYSVKISKHIQRIDKSEAMDILKKEINHLEGTIEKRRETNSKFGGQFIPYSLQSREKELLNLQEVLGEADCELFECCFLIYLTADSEAKLDELSSYIRSKGRNHQVIIDNLVGQQERGLNSVLPLAINELANEEINVCKTFITNAIANFIPFSFVAYFDVNGLDYGANTQTGNRILLDRTQELNANGYIVGTSGAGKSMTLKDEILSAMMKNPNDEFIIIDPDNEYLPLLEYIDGERIILSPSSQTHLNIFDTNLEYSTDDGNAIAMKTDFIMSFCAGAKGMNLSVDEMSIIDRVVKLVYREFQEHNGDKKYLPTLPKFYDTLKQQPEQTAADLALSIELYTRGTFDMFAHHTNIEVSKRFLIFDLFSMGEHLRTVGLQVVLEMIWQRVIENKRKGIRTWLWCDEFSVMFTGKDTSAGLFFKKVYQRIRKLGGVATAATQNITEVLESKEATAMLQNAEFLVLLQQKPKDLQKLVDLFELSESQMAYLKTGKVGTGLIICGKKIIPFKNLVPKDTLKYKLFSTKFDEKQRNSA